MNLSYRVRPCTKRVAACARAVVDWLESRVDRSATKPVTTVLLAIGVFLTASGPATSQDHSSVVIGVVSDGPAEAVGLVEAIEEELLALLHRGSQPIFKRAPEFTGDWSQDGAEAAVQAALDDPEVDLVLVPHGLTAAAASLIAAASELPKPVVLGFVQRADFFNLLDSTMTPRVSNISFVVTPHSLVEEISRYRAMVPFGTAYVAVDGAYAEFLQERARDAGNALSRAAEIDMRLLPIGPDGGADIEQVAADGGAILFLGGGRVDDAMRRGLFERAANQRVPVFSLEGHSDVAAGALAANVASTTKLVARRLALNIMDILRGRPTQELPVLLPASGSLLINGATAARVGYSPDIRTKATAEILYPEALEMGLAALDVRTAFGRAEGANVSIRIAERDVAISDRERRLRQSQFLPQVHFNPEYFVTNAQGLDGLLPDSALNLQGSLTQMIWDQRRVADYKSSRSVFEGTELELETRRLDTFAAAGGAFYELARTRALQQVLIANLGLTDTNLQLARLRNEVGFSGRDEVLRWESEVAIRRSEVVRSLARIAAAQVRLNQVMGSDQTLEWRPVIPEINPDRFPFLDGRLGSLFDDARGYSRFREFMVRFAYESAPELKTIGKGMEAQRYQLTERERRWYLPSFWLQAGYRYQALRSPELEGVSSSLPFVSINAQYPIFVGGARTQEVEKATEQLSRLTQEQELARQLIERRTRTSINRMEGSFAAIGLAQDATDAAEENLGLVQEKYIQGLVNVTDLLQAQNASFAAEQNLADVIYEFLKDFVDFQRAIAWFEAYQSEEAKADLARRIQEAIQ